MESEFPLKSGRERPRATEISQHYVQQTSSFPQCHPRMVAVNAVEGKARFEMMVRAFALPCHSKNLTCLPGDNLLPMAFDILIALAGYLVAPILIVLALALFIHCVLTFHRNRERRAVRSDSVVTTYPALPPRRTPAGEDSV